MGYGKRNNSIIQIDNEEIREKLEKINTEVLDAHFGYDGVARKTAGELTREMHKQLILGEQQTATLQQGANVVQSDQASALDVQIPGRTLVSLGNSVLTANKPYLLTAKGISLVFSDNTVFRGPVKFKPPLTEKPAVTLVSNFSGKVQGSAVENGAEYRRRASSILGNPDAMNTGGFFNPPQSSYDYLMSLDNRGDTISSSTSGNMVQHLFSFDAVHIVEKLYCKIPGSTRSEKVNWVRNNLDKINIDWYGVGSGPGGNKATIRLWNRTNAAWGTGMPNNTKPTAEKVVMYTGAPGTYIDDSGYVHLLAYAEPTDGITPSMISTDYIEIQLVPKAAADISQPSMPLYEVTQEEYDKAFITWNEDEVKKRYPAVMGAQSVVDPIVTVRGANLLPSFMVMGRHENAVIPEPYTYILKATADYQDKSYEMPAIPNQQYYLSVEQGTNGRVVIYEHDINGTYLNTSHLVNDTWKENIFTTKPNASFFRVTFGNGKGMDLTKETILKNPMLTFESKRLPFVPYNDDNLKLITPLRSIGNVKDLAYKEGDNHKISKRIGVQTLPGDQWYYETAMTGYKRIAIRGSYLTGTLGMKIEHDTYRLVSNKGEVFRNVTYTDRNSPGKTIYNGNSTFVVSLPNSETGWTEEAEPTVAQIKTYFTNNPFTLIYSYASPKVEEIPFEGAISLPGTTQVSVSQGGVAPIVGANAKFVSSLKSSVQQLQTNQADMQVKDQMILQSIADLYKQMAALGG